MTARLLVTVTLSAFAAGGCFQVSQRGGGTAPTPMGATLLIGTWTTVSSSPGAPGGSLQESCTDFTWTVTNASGNTASGTFSATCLGGMQVSGVASGAITGTKVTWTANAAGVTPGAPPCPISLSGTAQLTGDELRIPYTGTTCQGAVSGTEILKRKTLS